MLIINGEFDVLRHEGEAYAHKLTEAGVPVTAVRFHGTIYGFVLLNVIADTPAARGAIAMACDHLRRVFATRSTRDEARLMATAGGGLSAPCPLRRPRRETER